MAARPEDEVARLSSKEGSDEDINRSDDLRLGTIHACYRPGPLPRERRKAKRNRRSPILCSTVMVHPSPSSKAIAH
jgi:hypothetical protein